MNLDLSEREINFILLLRNFDFLRSVNYYPKGFNLYGKETYIEYENSKINQIVYIEWAPRNYIEIKIAKKSLFKGSEFELKNIYKNFDVNALESPPMYVDMPDVIEYNAKFIQQHLMPVIKGETWIDELIKQNKK